MIPQYGWGHPVQGPKLIQCKQEADAATLQFSVNHYAGPRLNTTAGFVEKNRDELPKEATALLKNSYNPFIRLLADN